MTPDLDIRNTNALWASVLVETLLRAGVSRAVISPGSRSTPLTMALARRREIETIPVLDERSAAFFALGMAKVDLRPVVLVCTSGTAAANYFPAIIEAHESAVPLIVITADRPPELRSNASGQTIDQQKLFGGYVDFYHEFAVPELDSERLRYLRQTTRHAVARTISPQRGPVHLNAPFRDPLPPLADGGAAAAFAAKIDWGQFFRESDAALSVSPPPCLPDWPADVHGLIVVGPNQPAKPREFVAGIAALAQRLGWPILADALSPVRHHAAMLPNVVTTYDAILRSASAAVRLAPEIVVNIGGWPTSKVLRGWLEANDPVIWLLTDRHDNRDALHGRTRQLRCDVASLASIPVATAEPSGYQQMWARYEQKARAAIDDRLRTLVENAEPKAAWILAQQLPAGTPVIVANSMPVRDIEYVWPASGRELRTFCNRGANGIDGTLSTALGVAQGTGRPSVLLTGDLALLHDSNGLLLTPQFRGSLTIVLINNAGGGIFEHLPVAQFEPPFERYFATPQEVDFATWCAAHRVEHRAIVDWAEFSAAISTLPPAGIRVFELRTNRKRDAALRKQWFTEIAASVA